MGLAVNAGISISKEERQKIPHSSFHTIQATYMYVCTCVNMKFMLNKLSELFER